MMLCRMAFHLLCKVVALHLDNNNVKAYLCNSRWYSVSFSFQAGLLDTESDWQAWYYSHPIIHSYPSQCGCQSSVPGSEAFRVAFSPSGGSSTFSPLGSTWGGSVGSPLPLNTYIIMPWKLHSFWEPWGWMPSTILGCFKYIMCFLLPHYFPLVLSKFLAEHVKGQLRLLILVAPCWMGAPWLPTVLNMLADVPWQCPIIKDLIMDVSVGHMLKGLPYLAMKALENVAKLAKEMKIFDVVLNTKVVWGTVPEQLPANTLDGVPSMRTWASMNSMMSA